MKIKDNSIRVDFTPQLIFGLAKFEKVYTEVTGFEPIITSGSEQSTKHSATSLHYSGNAADIRSRTILDVAKQTIIDIFKEDMTIDFDLILEGEGTENEHFHLEYQPKRR